MNDTGNPTTVAATGTVGSLAIAIVTVGVLGVAATSGVGDATAEIDAARNVTVNLGSPDQSVSSTASAQPLTEGTATVGLGAVESTASAGTATASLIKDDTGDPTGVEADVQIGIIAGTIVSIVEFPDGAESVLSAGDPATATQSPSTVTPDGAESTGQVGTIQAQTDGGISVPVDGAESTAAAQPLTSGTATVGPEGVSSTASAGTATVDTGSGNDTATPTGVQATTAAEELLQLSMSLEADGSESTTAAGTAAGVPSSTSVTDDTATPTGVEATLTADTVGVNISQAPMPDGASATSEVGGVDVATTGSVFEEPSGVSSTAQAGDITPSAQQLAETQVSGVEATGQVGDAVRETRPSLGSKINFVVDNQDLRILTDDADFRLIL